MTEADLITKHLTTAGELIVASSSESQKIALAAKMATETIKAGGTVFWCGNGGSAADSQHLAAELIGRYKLDRKPISSIALTTDTSILTAIGNDFGFEHIFSRQIQGLGKENDLLIALSTSGTSINILNALETARSQKIKTVLLTSIKYQGSDADCVIQIPSTSTEMIQHAHTAIGHVICEIVESQVLVG